MHGFFISMATIGAMVLVTGLGLALAGWDQLATRMPTQAPPRWLARWTLAVGAGLLVLGLVGTIVPT